MIGRTLHLTVLALLAATMPAAAQRSDSVEVYNHRLTMAELGQAMQATRNLDAATRADPQLARRINSEASGNPAETIDQITARLGKEPAVMKAITSAGMTPRTYTVAFLSLATTATQREAVKAGAAPATPAIADNIKLYERNQLQFERWGNELRSMQAASSSNPDLVQPSPDKSADIVRPAPDNSADIVRPAPDNSADVVRPAPDNSADVVRPAPDNSPDIEKPQPDNSPDIEKPDAGQT